MIYVQPTLTAATPAGEPERASPVVVKTPAAPPSPQEKPQSSQQSGSKRRQAAVDSVGEQVKRQTTTQKSRFPVAQSLLAAQAMEAVPERDLAAEHRHGEERREEECGSDGCDKDFETWF
jgi:hypothetical protein